MIRSCLTFAFPLLALLAGGLLWPTALLAGPDKFELAGDKWVPAVKPAVGSPAGELALARDLFEKHRYAKAVRLAGKFIKKYPDSPQYENVCLLAGRAEIQRHRYYQAYEWFEKQLDQFPAGKLSARALSGEYEVADAFLSGRKRLVFGFIRLDGTSDALEILTRIADHAPGTEIASKSLLRLADHYYAAGQWPEAVNAYDSYVQLFPKSTKTGYAAGRAAEATWLSFAGTQFDQTPLIEAQQRFSILLEAYPAEAAKLGARRILRQIASARAKKLLETAQFYERTSKPSAAAYYYAEVVRRYPAGEWARRARAALKAMGAVSPAKPADTDNMASRRKAPATAGRTGPIRPDMPRNDPKIKAARTSKGHRKR